MYVYVITGQEISGIRKMMFKLNDYHKFGLYHDDVYPDENYNPVVQEAVRRLPGDVYDMRNYRQIRAFQCDIEKEHLPQDQWTSYEDDLKNGRYMQPYIEEVSKELKEREDWEKAHSR